MIDFRSAMEQRAKMITANNPDRIVRYEAYTNGQEDWGIVTVMDSERNIRHFEFFETENSWRRSNAANDYNIGVREGYPVYVIVPDSVYQDAVDEISSSGGRVDISTYGRCQIAPRILA